MLRHFGTLIMLFALVHSSIGISCFKYSNYENKKSIDHHADFCYAVYDPAFESGDFQGAVWTPKKKINLSWSFEHQSDCQIQRTRLHEGQDYVTVHTCVCFTNFCNFPYSYEEFKKRGFTLADQ